MPFQPNAGEIILFNQVRYRVDSHPALRDIPYGQEGRSGTVYRLVAENKGREAKALKVFKPVHRNPSLVYQAELLEAYTGIRGLSVCSRQVVTPELEPMLLKQHPDLLYSVVMPWIEGPTWLDILLDKVELTREMSLQLALRLAQLLSGMEQRGLAHCDLSAPNILLPCMREAGDSSGISGGFDVELVDVEQMFGRGLDRPEVMTGGSPGYSALRAAPAGIWSKYGDRFAGAILLAEMLSWTDPEIREASWGESYYAPEEMQSSCRRMELMEHSLRANWGEETASLFARAWGSGELVQCPTFGEWFSRLIALDASAPLLTVPYFRGNGLEQVEERQTDVRQEPEPEPEAGRLRHVQGGGPDGETALEASSEKRGVHPTAYKGNGAIPDGGRTAVPSPEKRGGQHIPSRDMGGLTSTPSSSSRIKAAVEAGKAMELAGNLEGAIDVYRSALAESPGHGEWNTELLQAIGELEQKRRLAWEAEQDYERLRTRARKRWRMVAAGVGGVTAAAAIILMLTMGTTDEGVMPPAAAAVAPTPAVSSDSSTVGESPVPTAAPEEEVSAGYEEDSPPVEPVETPAGSPEAPSTAPGAGAPTVKPTAAPVATVKPTAKPSSPTPKAATTAPTAAAKTPAATQAPAATKAPSPTGDSGGTPAAVKTVSLTGSDSVISSRSVEGNAAVENGVISFQLAGSDSIGITFMLKETFTGFQALAELTSESADASVVVQVFPGTDRPEPLRLTGKSATKRASYSTSEYQEMRIVVTNRSSSTATLKLKNVYLTQ